MIPEPKKNEEGQYVDDDGKRINRDGTPWTGDGVQDAHRSDGKAGGNDIGVDNDDKADDTEASKK